MDNSMAPLASVPIAVRVNLLKHHINYETQDYKIRTVCAGWGEYLWERGRVKEGD
jgi:hypothetical protein